MFSTLESAWDRSARRGWTTLVSFTMQALALSLLLAIPLIWVQRPPHLQWLQPLSTPTSLSPSAPAQIASGHHAHSSAFSTPRMETTAPLPFTPNATASNDATSVPDAPDWNAIGTGDDRGSKDGILRGIGGNLPVVIPPRPRTKPLPVSHWAEGNLIYRVQPAYPPLARQARIHGTVQLRAIISKAGRVENLVVVAGHPLLVQSAIEAVRQWRYRPYMLNNEPIEVETEITVNFLLSGG